MNLFFSDDIRGDFAWFDEEEARHGVQVLRKKAGDQIQFVDGEGGWYEGLIEESAKWHLVVKIVSRKEEVGKKNYRLHLAVAPTKSIERFEWFLEKATEIGIDEITPLHCEHSERTKIRNDRLQKILLSAMKQSLRAYLPKLDALTDFEQFLKHLPTTNHHAPIKNHFIAHCRSENLPHLKSNLQPAQDVTILIGPEGDFSQREIDLATGHGFQSVSLGEARLRTETAAIVACHTVNLTMTQGNQVSS
jgi:16S rRNA (uracil1498-N3)-methyltransferase